MTNTTKPTQKTSGDVVKFDSGDVLFSQGDPGGDLYFIQSGEVEIFTKDENHEIVRLAVMRQGEVIGVMTCLTDEARLASARAISTTTVKLVKYEQIKKTMSEIPKWMGIVLKEFTLRIKAMNKQYGDAVIESKTAKKQRLTKVQIGRQVAAMLLNWSQFQTETIDNHQMVIISKFSETIQSTLGYDKKDIDLCIDILKNSGCLKIEIEQDKKREAAKLDDVKKLKSLVEFLDEIIEGRHIALLKAKFSTSEFKMLGAMVQYLKIKKHDVSKPVTINTSEYETQMEKITGRTFNAARLIKAERFKFIQVEGEKDQQKISFVPATLAAQLANLNCAMRLQIAEDPAAAKTNPNDDET